MKKKIKAWAWVYTDSEMQKQPIIAVDETREIMSEIKKKHLTGISAEHTKLLRSLYRKSKIVPIEIHYEAFTKTDTK